MAAKFIRPPEYLLFWWEKTRFSPCIVPISSIEGHAHPGPLRRLWGGKCQVPGALVLWNPDAQGIWVPSTLGIGACSSRISTMMVRQRHAALPCACRADGGLL